MEHPKDGLPVELFASPGEWEAWLADHWETSRGLWLQLAKKSSGIASVTYADLDRLFADLPPLPRIPDPRSGQAFGYGHVPGYVPGYGQPIPGPPAYPGPSRGRGPIGQVRSTGVQMLLFVVTFGLWSFVYFFQTHEELRRHSGEGLGGVLALLLSFFVGAASPFLLSSEVGALYERTGLAKPVSALTGLWVVPGFVLLVGPIIWFVQTNGAVNAYWRSLGAR